ncbi:ABC transporter substrate-binding protein [Paenibacillus sp. NPDC058071]|uniref:ABC transporter substrate-binding protein n=1 Tax=Paenibacillus sp. NPDC058071 TaxID=3346326 RepID=UPI0036D7F9E3
MKKTFVWLLLSIAVYTSVSCSNGGGREQQRLDSPSTDTEKKAKAAVSGQITLKFFTALADRTNGIGKVEQQLIDDYMAENPNVKIEVEALQDEPYKAKMKVYASTETVPDIIQTWGQASFIKPLIDHDLLLELNAPEFAGSGFVPGAMDGFMQNGKVYGMPRSADFLILYYNKKLFADNGVKVPETEEELLEAAIQLKNKGINPITTNALEGWSLPIWFEYAAQRRSGDFNKMDRVLSGQGVFSDDADFLAAAEYLQSFAHHNALAEGFMAADYGTSRNLFGQGQTAMYLMGNWEAGLSVDENFPEEVRNQMAAIPYPISLHAKATDVAAWFGGGYSVSKNSAHPEEAVAFLRYFFKPEHWAKQVWQNGAGMPAQQITDYLTGDESALQLQLVDLFGSITSSSGTPMHDKGTDEYKAKVMEAHQRLLGRLIEPEQFLRELDDAVALMKP